VVILWKYRVVVSAKVYLRVIAWDFVGVKRESETPVLHLSLIALLRHCSPSLRHVSYTAPQSSVTAGVQCLSVQ